MSSFIPWNSQLLDAWRRRHASGKVVSLNGRSTHYVARGQGEPVVLVHGFNMDLNTWMFNIDALAERFKVFALDLWGLGFSSRAPLDYGYDLYAKQLELFFDAMGIEQATLVGHSMGGGTAITFSLRHPQRVHKLVLVDATGIPNPLPLRAKLFTMPRVGEFLLGINNDYLRRKNLQDVWLFDGNMLGPDLFARVSQFQKVAGTSEVLLEILRKEFFHTLDAEVRQLDETGIPTLIVWGRHDVSIPLEIGEQMHQAISGSRFVVIDDCGHMPNFERPAQFNKRLLAFI
jgi:pimeloyl-ACP methyl ester carboxylesterase